MQKKNRFLNGQKIIFKILQTSSSWHCQLCPWWQVQTCNNNQNRKSSMKFPKTELITHHSCTLTPRENSSTCGTEWKLHGSVVSPLQAEPTSVSKTGLSCITVWVPIENPPLLHNVKDVGECITSTFWVNSKTLLHNCELRWVYILNSKLQRLQLEATIASPLQCWHWESGSSTKKHKAASTWASCIHYGCLGKLS